MFAQSFIAAGIFLFFMGATYLSPTRRALDYCTSTHLVVWWFIFGTLTVFYATDVSAVFTLNNIWVSVFFAVATIIVMFIFSHYWQRYGRRYMPGGIFNNEVTTFYAFTPRYTLSKGLEIFFQNVVAAAIILNIYHVVGSLIFTGLIFGIAFLLVHSASFLFFGPEWIVFITLASFIAGIVPIVLLLLIPGGILMLFSFHVLMYLLFLIIIRRRILRRKGYVPL